MKFNVRVQLMAVQNQPVLLAGSKSHISICQQDEKGNLTFLAWATVSITANRIRGITNVGFPMAPSAWHLHQESPHITRLRLETPSQTLAITQRKLATAAWGRCWARWIQVLRPWVKSALTNRTSRRRHLTLTLKWEAGWTEPCGQALSSSSSSSHSRCSQCHFISLENSFILKRGIHEADSELLSSGKCLNLFHASNRQLDRWCLCFSFTFGRE